MFGFNSFKENQFYLNSYQSFKFLLASYNRINVIFYIAIVWIQKKNHIKPMWTGKCDNGSIFEWEYFLNRFSTTIFVSFS